ncbi:PAS sensor protein [Defluviimonas sp. 20V17]|uniref:PAS domain S-box-containing protein n=1 Tax=Allgaiera indica TaxID=765699 RepID=A0AAN4UPL8_9RHOB|nr:PAS domain S-box protein [Allgaiera indica]KDB03918.1 PAS sensor protein [Defluviimonas sp. 20V17]GHD99195.1 transcriptional regulator [Allgaiera indica]SDW31569.1 PAS domain S-box-containing protein [Allgaiera indica]
MATEIDFRQLVEEAGDAVIASDASGVIVLWNAAATRIFGFTRDEALGQTLDLITPERFRARHWAGYRVTMETGVTRYGATLLRVPALHRDGRSLSIAFTVTLLRDGAGKVEQIVAIVRDETERWQEERTLKAKLKTLEAREGIGN